MSATVAYRCDRCATDAELPVVDGVPVPLPDGWSFLGLQGVPVQHLCAGCWHELDLWLHPSPTPAAADTAAADPAA